MADQTTVVDFVAKGESSEQWKMVLVEEGPWSEPVEDHLRRVQGRLYGCLDAALDGELAKSFPDTKGKDVVVQLDCYNVPKEEVEEFFNRFSDGVFAAGDYLEALKNSQFVRSVGFEINFDSIHQRRLSGSGSLPDCS